MRLGSQISLVQAQPTGSTRQLYLSWYTQGKVNSSKIAIYARDPEHFARKRDELELNLLRKVVRGMLFTPCNAC